MCHRACSSRSESSALHFIRFKYTLNIQQQSFQSTYFVDKCKYVELTDAVVN